MSSLYMDKIKSLFVVTCCYDAGLANFKIKMNMRLRAGKNFQIRHGNNQNFSIQQKFSEQS